MLIAPQPGPLLMGRPNCLRGPAPMSRYVTPGAPARAPNPGPGARKWLDVHARFGYVVGCMDRNLNLSPLMIVGHPARIARPPGSQDIRHTAFYLINCPGSLVTLVMGFPGAVLPCKPFPPLQSGAIVRSCEICRLPASP